MSRKSLVPIVLPVDPVSALEASTKGYVDFHSPPTVVKSTAPVAADFGLGSIPVGAVWIQSP
jgi:hypothetical protein